MKKLLQQYISIAAATVMLIASVLAVVPVGVGIASAQLGITDEQLGVNYAAGTGLASTDVRVSAARIIRAALGILGIVALVIVIIAGFTWMTAGGNEEKVGEAKKWLTAGIIGLVIILSAYSIVTFALSNLLDATQQ